jgi:hypothetical protein
MGSSQMIILLVQTPLLFVAHFFLLCILKAEMAAMYCYLLPRLRGASKISLHFLFSSSHDLLTVFLHLFLCA